MDLELTDKVAIVTGANKGIGLAITKALAAEGAYAVAGSLSTENLDALDRAPKRRRGGRARRGALRRSRPHAARPRSPSRARTLRAGEQDKRVAPWVQFTAPG